MVYVFFFSDDKRSSGLIVSIWQPQQSNQKIFSLYNYSISPSITKTLRVNLLHITKLAKMTSQIYTIPIKLTCFMSTTTHYFLNQKNSTILLSHLSMPDIIPYRWIIKISF